MSKVEKQQVPKIRFEGFSQNWEKQKINKIVSINPRASLPELFNYVDLESVKGTTLIESRKEARDTAPSRAQRVAKKNDIFYQMVRPYQKNNYFFEKDHIDYVFSTGYAQLRPVKITGMFLFSKIQTSDFVNKVLVSCTGTSYPAINSSDLGLIDIFYPHELEQTQIGNFFQQLDKLIELQTRAVESSETYKKAMLQKMFPQKGEKVPRVRFEGFSGDWSEFKIGNVTSSYSGGTPSVTESSYYNGDIPFIRSGEIDSKETELFITELGLKNSSAKMVEEGDILYALYGATSGEVSRSKIKGAINQAILAIKPKTQFCSEYLCQLLGFMKDEIVKKYLQGGQGNLSGTIIKDLKIAFPDLKEQTKIGNFFQKLDQNIESEKKKLEQYQTMKRALLQRMFV